MGTQQKNLSILFRCIQPEMLYQSICSFNRMAGKQATLSASFIDEATFQSVAHTMYPTYSYEEIENIYYLIQSQMEKRSKFDAVAPSVFNLLVQMGNRTLRQTGAGLVCDFSQMLAWQNAFQDLGQDIFTTAFLASEDLRQNIPPRTEFTWDAIIKTDNNRLNQILRQGIAENHCHLGGTTQNFALSWACLMNHPQSVPLAAAQIKQNLQPSYSRGVSGNVWGWEQRLLWAEYLRLKLFRLLESKHFFCNTSFDMEAECFCPTESIQKELCSLRFGYGAFVSVKGTARFVLDYALRECDCQNGLLENHNRLLSGERSFLYRCFRACFDGTFDTNTQNWFYLYLLIKENFRAEIVQVNKQAGFHNFKDYQDRKDIVYDMFPGYRAEAFRLSVNANQLCQNIRSFEVRIAPKATYSDLYRQIHENELHIEHAGGLRESCHLFYVYHFIKLPDEAGKLEDKPRNYKIRRDCRMKAKAIAAALRRSPYLCEHVFGIDAANIEIGCRPEVFATEFRYLRSLPTFQYSSSFLSRSAYPHIHVTYHAGEDFLDVADGIRAIDEAVRFLHLRRGDRIGHALALGVSPEVHYKFKNNRAILPKQDLLDNMVWLLYRSQELGVEIEPSLRASLQTQAEILLSEIYGNYIQRRNWYVGLYEYYCAMQLRGDAPDLYFSLPYQKRSFIRENAYNAYQEDSTEKLTIYRQSETVSGLYQAYHYNPAIRRNGRASKEFFVNASYIALIRDIQDKMQQDLERQGIMIECNPTSNYLIGTFRRYEFHPIFRFNHAELLSQSGTSASDPQLSVSINTDDLGVFETSLENEYAVLAASLERAQTEDGRKKYTSDSIYKYLDNVRKMGLEQSFLFAEESLLRSNPTNHCADLTEGFTRKDKQSYAFL